MAGWPARGRAWVAGEQGRCGYFVGWDIEGVECWALRGLTGAGRGAREAELPVIIGVLAFDIKSD